MLTVEHLQFAVQEGAERLDIVRDVSFSVRDGEMLVITGPNGGGKSTVAKLLMGIETPTAGRILLDGKDITPLSIDERAKAGFGYAFQQPPRFKGLTVQRLLSLAAGHELSVSESCTLLSGVGLCGKEYLTREADATLSGGEMKRIEIATVLAAPHKVCIFDEPEAGIDLWSFAMLVEQFQAMHNKKSESLVLISHQERVIQMADNILVLRDGRVAEYGTRDEVYPKLFAGEKTDCACLAKGANCHEA